MHQLSTTDKSSEKRSRSLSPGDAPVQPSEAVRALRTFIREKDNEIEQLNRKLRAAEKHAADFVSKFEASIKTRKNNLNFFRVRMKLDDVWRNIWLMRSVTFLICKSKWTTANVKTVVSLTNSELWSQKSKRLKRPVSIWKRSFNDYNSKGCFLNVISPDYF